MNVIRILILLIIILPLGGCDNEIDINTDWKETPVVYAFLDPNVSTQYLRIEKTYQNSVDITTDQGAQINDSLYFDTIFVKVKGTGLPDVIFTRTTEIPKQAGFFSGNPHYLYKGNLTPIYNKGYTLEIYSPKTNNTYVASTSAIGTSDIKTATFRFAKPENFISITVTPIASATTVSATLRFKYLEYTGSITSADTFNVDYILTETPVTVSDGIRYNINNRSYVNYLKDVIPVKAAYTRQIIGFDMSYVGAGKELSDLMEIMKPSAAIVQKKLEYSNISGGLGIFSSRSENLDFNIQNLGGSNWAAAKPDLISLLNADPKNLNFIP